MVAMTAQTLRDLVRGVDPSERRPLVFLTGAGVSAASGIPTFRGPEGYWRIGSTHYHPQEMATHAAYARMPREVWRWYLYRRGVCRRAEPNAGHRLLAAMERKLGTAFWVITQNVDGLHVRGGCKYERVLEIHGSIDWMRDEDTGERFPIPEGIELRGPDDALTDKQWASLVNPQTGARCRPHVLWFDEYYDEENFRAQTALEVAASACALVVCGTSGAASLPYRCVELAWQGGARLADICTDPNPFRDAAAQAATEGRGAVFDGTAVEGITEVAAALGVA